MSYSPVGLVSFGPVDDCYFRVCSTYHYSCVVGGYVIYMISVGLWYIF